ncbi:MAG: cytochrome c oxidase subunit II [Candidatus Neomarinimicrobiota bacterium]|nr:cytochrome c oxidase subunit II [Candidatus Neomarinimicrobiota bacterium]
MLELLRKIGFTEGYSAQSPAIDSAMSWVHILMLVLYVGWGGFFIYTLIRFRRKKNPKADPIGVRNHYSTYSEASVAVFEIILLVVFSFPVWASRVENIPDKADSEVIRVIGQQFKWNIHYPGEDGVFGRTASDLIDDQALNFIGLDWENEAAVDDIIPTQGHLHLPVDREIIIEISTRDVIHSFGIPVMRVKQDAIPGLRIPTWFTPTKTGSWEIACAQLCGNSHYEMKGYVHVHTQKGYEAYLKTLAVIQEVNDYDYTYEAEATLKKVLDALKVDNESKAEELTLLALSQAEAAKGEQEESGDDEEWDEEW